MIVKEKQRDIKVSDRVIPVSEIGEIEGLRVQWSPRTSGAVGPPRENPLPAQGIHAFPDLDTKGLLLVLRYPHGLPRSHAKYGLVSGYRRWQGAKRKGLRNVHAKVIYPTVAQYNDPSFLVWVQRLAYRPTLKSAFVESLRPSWHKSIRTLYRDVQIADNLNDEVLSVVRKLSGNACLELSRAHRDDQLAILRELKDARRPLTAGEIQAAVCRRYHNITLPSLTPLRTATALCRKLRYHVGWSAQDIAVARDPLVDHVRAVLDLWQHFSRTIA
jgi:hypothetical protein